MNVFGMGPMELLLIIILALIVFGPAKLPEIMGQVGKAINDFRNATSGLSEEFNRTIQAELQEGRSMLAETKSAVTDVHSTVNSVVTGAPTPTRTAVPEALPAANGTSPESYPSSSNGTSPESYASGSNGTSPESHTSGSNGSLPEVARPPLADTTQWSWETAAPSAPASPSPARPPSGSSTDAPAAPTDASVAPPAPAPKEPTARDELLPPY